MHLNLDFPLLPKNYYLHKYYIYIYYIYIYNYIVLGLRIFLFLWSGIISNSMTFFANGYQNQTAVVTESHLCLSKELLEARNDDCFPRTTDRDHWWLLADGLPKKSQGHCYVDRATKWRPGLYFSVIKCHFPFLDVLLDHNAHVSWTPLSHNLICFTYWVHPRLVLHELESGLWYSFMVAILQSCTHMKVQ
jgi:hypothetical protein